jgi:hypothetical protein
MVLPPSREGIDILEVVILKGTMWLRDDRIRRQAIVL